jgi:phthalate 4,5-cis-dihydrodiol dehydrogenase
MVRKLKLGVVGLGRAFALTAPTLARDPRVALVAATDPRREAVEKAEKDFGARGFRSLDDLLESDAEAIYIATPHRFHAAQAIAAARAGKHVLVEKPMALTLKECAAMAAAAKKHRVRLVVGPSHSFDLPIRTTRRLIDTGRFGSVRMITAFNFTDFLYRPRMPDELRHAILNQSAHHVDIVRFLVGRPLKSVRAHTVEWKRAPGGYSALLDFGSCFANIAYSGNAHFDSDEFTCWIGELGQQKHPAEYGGARRSLAHRDELRFKTSRNYGGAEFKPGKAQFHEHFGPIVVSCDKADLRPLPTGVMIYADGGRRVERLAPTDSPRTGVIDELYEAVVNNRKPLHDAAWGLATIEACLAIVESGRTGKEVPLRHQTSASRT